jgi:hypothetical protein
MMQILEASLLPLVFVASSFSTRPGELYEHVKIAELQENDQTGWSGGNALDMYLEGV